jgi:predicted Mrr-cat superfamily restriction endonuclease
MTLINLFYQGGFSMAKAWLVRSEFSEGSMIGKFLEDGVISIDYRDLPSLKNLSEEEIKQTLKEQYPSFNNRQISMRVNTLIRMATESQEDDFVVVTDKENIHFGKIVGDYMYIPEKKDEGLSHQRKVEWLKGPVLRGNVPDLIRGSLQAPISFSDISQLSDLLRKFILGIEDNDFTSVKKAIKPKRAYAKPWEKKRAKEKEKEKALAAKRKLETQAEAPPAPAPKNELKTFSYPIRFDQDVIVQLPRDITQQEAARLAEYVRTLYFK